MANTQEMSASDLEYDAKRMEEYRDASTGIYVRAQLEGRWASVDIAWLTRESLLQWLRSRGGENPWAEDVVGILLGHGHLHPVKKEGEGNERGS